MLKKHSAPKGARYGAPPEGAAMICSSLCGATPKGAAIIITKPRRKGYALTPLFIRMRQGYALTPLLYKSQKGKRCAHGTGFPPSHARTRCLFDNFPINGKICQPRPTAHNIILRPHNGEDLLHAARRASAVSPSAACARSHTPRRRTMPSMAQNN